MLLSQLQYPSLDWWFFLLAPPSSCLGLVSRLDQLHKQCWQGFMCSVFCCNAQSQSISYLKLCFQRPIEVIAPWRWILGNLLTLPIDVGLWEALEVVWIPNSFRRELKTMPLHLCSPCISPEIPWQKATSMEKEDSLVPDPSPRLWGSHLRTWWQEFKTAIPAQSRAERNGCVLDARLLVLSSILKGPGLFP